MQGGAAIGAQADDIARIRRNFGLEKHDVEHGMRACRREIDDTLN
jgi:hypothetical protein